MQVSPTAKQQLAESLTDVLMPASLRREMIAKDYHQMLENLYRHINKIKQIQTQLPDSDQYFMTTLVADLQGYLANMTKLKRYLH